MKEETSGLFSCGCMLLILIFNVIIGGWSVNYLLLFFLEKAIPFYAAMLIGLFVAEVSVPVAIIIAILRFFGAI